MRDFKLAMHYYRVYLGRFSWWLLGAIATVLIFAVTNAASPMFLGRAITALTNTVQHGQSLSVFYVNAGILAALYTASSFGDWATSMILSWVGGTATGDMRTGLFKKNATPASQIL